MSSTGNPTPPPTDEDLALAARAGCRASFEQLARRFQVPLVHFLSQWTSREQAEDLTQETLLRAYQNLHRYRARWKFRTWLFTIARRLCLNATRRRRPSAGTEELAMLTDPSHPADSVAASDSRRHLWQTVARVLSEREMTAMWLYYTEDMPLAEIARVVGRSTSAVKTMLFRSRKKLADALPPPDDSRPRDTRPARAALEKTEATHD